MCKFFTRCTSFDAPYPTIRIGRRSPNIAKMKPETEKTTKRARNFGKVYFIWFYGKMYIAEGGGGGVSKERA